MSRLILTALLLFSATPALAGTAHATLRVGVTVVYDPLPAVTAPAPTPPSPPSDNSSGH